MSKGFLAICIMLAIMLALVGVVAAIQSNENNDFERSKYEVRSHYVEKGDTLWELATYCKDDSDNIQSWIAAVKKLNGMSGSGLTAGTYIDIYVAR